MRFVIGTSTAFHLRHLAVQLRKHGQRVQFHSYLPRWKTRDYALPDSAVVSHFAGLLPYSAMALLRGWSRWLNPIRHRLFAMVDRRIARQIAASGEPIDVFVGLSSVAVASAQAARDKGALVLIECGISHIRNRELAATTYGAEQVDPLYVEREIASHDVADRIVLLSQFARQSFIAQGVDPARLEIISPGADLSRFTRPAQVPPLPVKALVVGNWSLQKGCDLIGPLLERLPGLAVTHVGSVLDAPLPASERFRTLGHQPQVQLAATMRDFHLLLFPSRDDGFGMVMAEALAAGLRVVASDTSGAPELAELVGADYVSVFASGSIDAFTDAVARQVAAIERDPSVCAAPLERIDELSWDGYGRRYLAMVERLLGERACPA